jgi:hypothetical protein
MQQILAGLQVTVTGAQNQLLNGAEEDAQQAVRAVLTEIGNLHAQTGLLSAGIAGRITGNDLPEFVTRVFGVPPQDLYQQLGDVFQFGAIGPQQQRPPNI